MESVAISVFECFSLTVQLKDLGVLRKPSITVTLSSVGYSGEEDEGVVVLLEEDEGVVVDEELLVGDTWVTLADLREVQVGHGMAWSHDTTCVCRSRAAV